jgi:hypothetical protein
MMSAVMPCWVQDSTISAMMADSVVALMLTVPSRAWIRR